MIHARRFRFGSCVMALLLSAACGSGGDGGTSGNGGAAAGTSGMAGAGPGAAGTTGNGGSVAGTAGTTAGTAGTGTAGSAAPGTAGSNAGGGTTGAGGSGGSGGSVGGGGTVGNAGRGGGAAGAAGTGGRGGGTAGTVGAGGRGGSAGGTTGTGGAGSGDEYVSGVTVTVSPMVNTILIVSWTQARAADQGFLEFSFAGSSVMTSRAVAGAAGAHRDVVLGIPGSTAVTVRIVSRLSGVDYKTRDYQGTTGAVPTGMPVAQVSMYDATAASPDRWLFGVVENSPGTCANRSCYLVGPYWVYIMDRQGRVVWYYTDTTSNASIGFPRVARDGEYIWIDKARTGTRGVLKTTLDRQTFTQNVAVSGLADAIDVTTDGSLLYDANNELRELTRAGTTRTIWSCR